MLNKKLIIILILFIFSTNIFGEEPIDLEKTRTFSASYLPDKQLSFGAIKTGEIVNLSQTYKEKFFDKNGVFTDSNNIKYKQTYRTLYINNKLLSACHYKSNQSDLYKEYYNLKTEHTSNIFKSLYNRNNYNNLWFKSYKTISSEIGYTAEAITGSNDIVLSYEVKKSYEFIPDQQIISPKLESIFGKISKTHVYSPNDFLLWFDDVEANDIYTKMSKSERNLPPKNITNGIYMHLRVSNHHKFINYLNRNIQNFINSYYTYYDQCTNDIETGLSKIIALEKEHKLKETSEFIL